MTLTQTKTDTDLPAGNWQTVLAMHSPGPQEAKRGFHSF